jgi:pimeloyl-ACP methyl ester carboxylesterase
VDGQVEDLRRKTNEISLSTMIISNSLRVTLFSAALVVGATLAASAPSANAKSTPSVHWMKVHGGYIAYDDSGGNGPIIICVPGLGDLRQQYRFLAPRLKAAGFRVVTMDVRGHGQSGVDWTDYSAASVGADVVSLIHLLGAKKVYIIGNSMAGAAAVWAAAEIPGAFAGIVLIDPFVREMPPSVFLNAFLKVATLRPWGPSFWSMYYGSLYKSSPPSDLPAYREALVANLKEPGRIEAVKAMIFASKSPCEARIPKVRAPALVMMGSQDPDFDNPAAEAKWVADHLHGKKSMIAGAGHYPHVEYPDIVGAAIVAFIEEVGVGEARRY